MSLLAGSSTTLLIPSAGTVASRRAVDQLYSETLLQWRVHPKFRTTLARHFVDDVHGYFRSEFGTIATAANGMLKIREEMEKNTNPVLNLLREVSVANKSPTKNVSNSSSFLDLQLRFGRAVENLSHHHQAEDEHFFPQFAAKYKHDDSIVAQFGVLEKDHQLLHPIEEIALQNGKLSKKNSKKISPEEQEVQYNALLAMVEFFGFLGDHLKREDMLIVPMLFNGVL